MESSNTIFDIYCGVRMFTFIQPTREYHVGLCVILVTTQNLCKRVHYISHYRRKYDFDGLRFWDLVVAVRQIPP